MKNQFPQIQFGSATTRATTTPATAAFTLIEILVVVAIIAILAGLIVAGSGPIMLKSHLSRVTTERETLVAALQSYKKAKGTYPPDNPNPANATQSPLFYELTGVTITALDPTGAPMTYYSSVTGETFPASAVSNLFGVAGFVNASTNSGEVQNFFGGTAKSARTGQVPAGANPAYTVFGVAVTGPLTITTAKGFITPWSYVSTNPTNNSAAYDLWLDMTGAGKTYRISNWRPDPQPL